MVHRVVLPAVSLRVSGQYCKHLFVGVERGHLAARACELHRRAGQVVVAQKHEATLMLPGLQQELRPTYGRFDGSVDLIELALRRTALGGDLFVCGAPLRRVDLDDASRHQLTR